MLERLEVLKNHAIEDHLFPIQEIRCKFSNHLHGAKVGYKLVQVVDGLEHKGGSYFGHQHMHNELYLLVDRL